MSDSSARRALVSVSDKAGLAPFIKQLTELGFEIISTGGTRRHLEEAGVPVIGITEYTGFPEIMEGRVKTLHPKVHGAILGRPDRPDDAEAIAEHEIVPFELVVCNLYPFEETIAREGVTVAEAIEQIDIGGPSMVRSAAKNHAYIAIVTQVRNRWWWGFGIRWTPHGWMWNISGLDAVELTYHNGKKFRIGTDEPEALLEALKVI